MSDDPAPEAIDDDAVDVAATTAAYEDAPARYVEKFRERALADRFGEQFVYHLPGSPSGPRVLDVGCGPSADAAVFADREFETVGLDLSENLVRAANDEVAAAGFVRGDMRTLPFGTGAFEGLWSSTPFLHLARGDAPGALAEFARVLGEDGALFLSVMARESNDADAVETGDGRRFTLWRKPDLVSALDTAGFEVVWDSGQSDWHALVAVRE